MSRTQIPPDDGSFFPTVHGPFGRAVEKLNEAQHGILEMKAAKDRVSYELGWTRFVDSISEFWPRFWKEGEQLVGGAFVGWVGKYQHERDNDELLAYVTEARNQSQHGLVSLGWTAPGGLIAGQRFAGQISSLKVYTDGTYEAVCKPQPDSPTAHPVVFDFGKPKLPLIRSFREKKNPKDIPPPVRHRGASITDLSPADAAALALAFYGECLEAALTRFASKLPRA